MNGCVRYGMAGLAAATLATAAVAEADKTPAPSVAGDPSCDIAPIALSEDRNGTRSAAGVLQDRAGTLVREGVAAIRVPAATGLLSIDARWADASTTTGPDIEIVRCEAVDATALLPEGVTVRERRGILGSLAKVAEGSDVITAAPRPRRLDRAYDRNLATSGMPGRSRAALTLVDRGDYVVLVGGARAGTAFTAEIEQRDDDRPVVRALQMPTTQGSITADSARQAASLRPYVLHDLKIDVDGPVLFRGTASAPMFLEVGDVSDDAAFDWFGLRRAASASDSEGEVERLMLWRTRVEPGTEAVFGLNLKQGAYFVRLRGATPAVVGDYAVTITTPAPEALLRIPDPEPISPGVTRGTLTIGDSFGQDANGAPQFRPARLYRFVGKAGAGYEVRVESESPSLDPFVGAGGMLPVLTTPGNTSQRTDGGERFFALIANNDHAKVVGMRRPTDSCLFFTSQKDGPIILKVIGSQANQAGTFVLTLSNQPTGCAAAPKE